MSESDIASLVSLLRDQMKKNDEKDKMLLSIMNKMNKGDEPDTILNSRSTGRVSESSEDEERVKGQIRSDLSLKSNEDLTIAHYLCYFQKRDLWDAIFRRGKGLSEV